VDEMLSVTTSHGGGALVCCRCRRRVLQADELVTVPSCSHGIHVACRSCLLLPAALSYCPGCCVVPPPPRALTAAVNGSTTDANGNGALMTTCSSCGERTDQQSLSSCQSCAGANVSQLCQSCWQQHQLDVHVLPRLRLDACITTCLALPPPPVAPPAPAAGPAAAAVAGSVRQLRAGLMMTESSSTISSLLSGLSIYSSKESSAAAAAAAGGGDDLLAGGLHDPAVRRARLTSLQAPLCRQYEAWLWQALNNGGFEQALRAIDERRQQVGVNVQSTLREMELRLERARGVLDELYRDYMRQVIDVCRSQMETLNTQTETLQRVRSAAARLQHARLYNDKTRALAAETELSTALRHNAASTCLRPSDDASSVVEFRSPTDDELRAYVRSSCAVQSGVHTAYCSVHTAVDRDSVNCLSWSLVGRVSEFDVQLRNHCHVGVDDAALTVFISDRRGVELNYDYERRSAGHYVVRYRPLTTGTHHIYVLLRDQHLADSPYTVCLLAVCMIIVTIVDKSGLTACRSLMHVLDVGPSSGRDCLVSD